MLVVYGNNSWVGDYDNRLTNTANFLHYNVGPELICSHSFVKGSGWHKILLAASGFCGTQIWAITIYDTKFETQFRLTYPEYLIPIDTSSENMKRIEVLMTQQIDRQLEGKKTYPVYIPKEQTTNEN